MKLTPITVVHKSTNLRNGRTEIWEAISEDGVWGYKRTEESGTPWMTIHIPTDRYTMDSSLPKARKYTADGTTLAYLDATQPV